MHGVALTLPPERPAMHTPETKLVACLGRPFRSAFIKVNPAGLTPPALRKHTVRRELRAGCHRCTDGASIAGKGYAGQNLTEPVVVEIAMGKTFCESFLDDPVAVIE